MASFVFIVMLTIGLSSAFYCHEKEDNLQVINFKSKLNCLSIKSDIEKGLTKEQISAKMKYFSRCNKINVETKCLIEE